jgi:hypothetical protein
MKKVKLKLKTQYLVNLTIHHVKLLRYFWRKTWKYCQINPLFVQRKKSFCSKKFIELKSVINLYYYTVSKTWKLNVHLFIYKPKMTLKLILKGLALSNFMFYLLFFTFFSTSVRDKHILF